MRGKILKIPFGSDEFVFDEENFGVAFHEIEELMIARLRNVNQLQRLTHPSLIKESGYLWFPFPQTRFDHSILFVPALKKILTQAGFSQRFTEKVVLTLLTHDIATPAGGDATMRLNKEFFCEVRNYKRHMVESGIEWKWKKRHGFDLDESALWVEGFDFVGFLLNVLDRLSYTALDVHYLGKGRPARISKLLKKDSLIMDVWKDICILKNSLYFVDAERLYNFLFLRALMHSELYLNPNCRKLEHLFFSETKRLFNAGKISVDDLRYRDDRWLESVVRQEKDSSWCTHPETVSWQRFDEEAELSAFQKDNDSVFHVEKIKPFETGVCWPVMHGGKIVPLAYALPAKLIQELEKIPHERAGWYAYCYN